MFFSASSSLPELMTRIEQVRFVPMHIAMNFGDLRKTRYQPMAAVRPEARNESREKKKTAARTGMQKQKCLDIVACLCVEGLLMVSWGTDER